MDKTKNAKNTPAPPVKKGGGFGMGFLVASGIFLAIIILAGLAFGGWWYYKNRIKKSLQNAQQQMQQQTQTIAGTETTSDDAYSNSAFGFRLKMPASWKNYQAKSESLGGDFEVGRVSFFLPTAQKEGWESPDMPGYFNPFVITVCVKDSWDEALRANGVSMPMGEEIGRNNYFVFVWTHFNGDPPNDVSRQAILDMQTIVDSVEVFNVNGESSSADVSSPVASAVSGTSGLSWETGTKPSRDADFDYDSVYYWNCKHYYTLNYPTAWSNNGMTYDSNVVILKGNKVQVWVEAVSIPVSKTLDEFARERAAKIEGVQAWNETVDWGNGTTVFRATYTNPDSTALWWMSGSGYGMELKALGPGYNDNYSNINGLLATLDPNSQYVGAKCGSAKAAAPKTVAPKATTQSCSFPNGDIEYWWNTVSQSVRDCYTAKYGDPGL